MIGKPNGEKCPPIIVVIPKGEYPDGSKGNRHGKYIASMTMLALCEFDPWCLILDLRELDYRWGNTLAKVFEDVARYMDSEREPGDARFPVIVVTSDKSRAAFLSLVTPTNSPKPEWHYDTMGKAVVAAIEAANHWIDN